MRVTKCELCNKARWMVLVTTDGTNRLKVCGLCQFTKGAKRVLTDKERKQDSKVISAMRSIGIAVTID